MGALCGDAGKGAGDGVARGATRLRLAFLGHACWTFVKDGVGCYHVMVTLNGQNPRDSIQLPAAANARQLPE